MDLQKYQNNLPTTIEDLSKFVLVGREALTSVKASIRAIDKLETASEVREQKKQEAQWLASALLDAEVKIGDLNVFRREYHNLPTRKMIPNGDGTMFYAYSWKELPDDFIIARKHSGNNLKIYN